MTVATRNVVTRAEVEDFLYNEAALLDAWKLDEWQSLLTEDAAYYVPPNDQPEGDHRSTLFLIADDRERIRQRVIRINDPNCHAEFPKSRTRRMISNVRILAVAISLRRRLISSVTGSDAMSVFANMWAPTITYSSGPATASRSRNGASSSTPTSSARSGR